MFKFRDDFPISFCQQINDGSGCSARHDYDDDAFQDQYCRDCLTEVLCEIRDFFHLCDEKYKNKK